MRSIHSIANVLWHITSMDWGTYPILRFSDSPEMEIALLAVANAVFEATGVRPRQMPFTPERIRAALTERG